MNINLSSVSESPKVTKATTEGGDATSESSESGGFFSKLAALIKGEGESEGKVDKSQTKASAEGEEVSVDGDSETKSVKVAATESQSTDELLESEETPSAKSEKVASQGEESESAKPTVSDKQVVQANSQSAEKIVSDNDEVLQRLDHSNKALQPKDGKALPQDNSEQQVVADKSAQGGEEAAAVGATKLTSDMDDTDTQQANSKQKSVNTESEVTQAAKSQQQETVVVKSAEGEEVVVPASAERFVQQPSEQKNDELTEQQSSPEVPASVVGAAAVTQDDVVESASKQATPKVKSEHLQATNIASAENNAQVVSDIEQTEGSDSEVVEGVALAAGATVLGGAAVVAGSGAEKATDGASTVAVQAPSGAQSLAAAGESQTESDIDPSIAAATVAAGAIPWAASVEGQAKDDVAIKADTMPKAQQAQVAQSVHQAIVSQQSQAQLAQATQQQGVVPTMPTELAAAQMQQMAASPNAAMVQDQAMLKAVMGAKAAGTLGQMAANKDGAQQGAESNTGFAQQLAQASGQQGPGALGQVRAEQAAQAPLQLNRELAGEQVAERVQMMMSKNLKNIDIRLDPPELGRMQIRMHMNGDAATVHFTVANQQARDVIEQSMPRLREMLAQQGVQLGDSSVQQQASGQQQRRYADNGQGNNGQGSSNQGFSGEENLEPDINLDLNVAAKRDGISYYA
ncbi:flagellar hook-length control protein FliK [Vibrio tubiashii]|uniref:Flagellar hook-length control protein FliK n=1 Tax=Vibrio tubiashii ATCC 19109 TaxID=1051646 RepID=F9T4N0_9VIBR|nr:flagellar hook-length control protein FliK [Vibrio tubiashii]AIW13456.1 flagellar hook-length control protein FliK [Vibrio tubiashii ATCC 19109]EGU55770.1 flagellar hook-length control protein FliK [Vibrio tubiashii ATCC 19109]EIF05864.1 flagellar hook-length control protein FliK [Vibrio tubiashii NCIMB 1337 = ATCC 19106]